MAGNNGGYLLIAANDAAVPNLVRPSRPSIRYALGAAFLLLPAAAFAAEPRIVDFRLGLGGEYKLGHWAPVEVVVEGAAGLQVEVVAPDNDGAPAVFPATAGDTDARQTIRLLTRVGRRGTPLVVRLVEGGRPAATATATVGGGPGLSLAVGRPSTSRLVAELTPGPSLLAKAAGLDRRRSTAVASLADAGALPESWLAYEACDCLWINFGADDPALKLSPRQLNAIIDWVETGGRLVLAGAEGFAAATGAVDGLADLLPGRLDGVVTLRSSAKLEEYAGANQAMPGARRLELSVARLVEYAGRVEADAGGRGAQLPLVVRQRRGFGHVVFVGVDLSRGPLAGWPDAAAFAARAAGIVGPDAEPSADTGPGRGSGRLLTAGYTDLSGAVQQRLGARFGGVVATPMLAIVAAAIGYLLLIGPIDYLLLGRVLGRLELTWATFPAVVVAFAGGSYLLANRYAGEQPRINQLAIIDVDVASGVTRGLVWAQAYSPVATRYDARVTPRGVAGPLAGPAGGYVTWLGMPGGGLAGVDTQADSFSATAAAYRHSETLGEIAGVPINTRSTKSLVARWRGKGPAAIECRLAVADSGLIEGVLTNASGGDLRQAWLAAGDWAWRLGDIADGAVLSIDDTRVPLTFNTLIRRDYLQPGDSAGAAPQFDANNLSLDGLAMLTMFTDTLRRSGFTTLGNGFTPPCDLSGALADGHAVLVARGAQPDGLLKGGAQAGRDPSPDDRCFYRFVLPVTQR